MEQKKKSHLGNYMISCLAAAYLLAAAVLLWIPQLKITYICSAICVILMIFGIYMIVRYFLTDGYQNADAYGFSVGSLLLVLGICGLLRTDKLADSFMSLTGVGMIFIGIVLLQHGLDLIRMKDFLWIPEIVIAVVVTVASVIVVTKPFEHFWLTEYDGGFLYFMMVCGGLCLLSTFYVIVRSLIYKKMMAKKAAQAEQKTETCASGEWSQEEAVKPVSEYESKSVQDIKILQNTVAEEVKTNET